MRRQRGQINEWPSKWIDSLGQLFFKKISGICHSIKNVNKVRPLSFDEVFYAVSKNLYLQFKIAVKFTALLLSDELQNFPVLRFKIGVASSLSSMFTFQIFPKRGAGLGRRRRVRYRENHKQFIVRKRFSKL